MYTVYVDTELTVDEFEEAYLNRTHGVRYYAHFAAAPSYDGIWLLASVLNRTEQILIDMGKSL